MEQLFNKWLESTAEQKEVYASAVGLSIIELESQYQQWYCWKLINKHHAVPISVQCEAFNGNCTSSSMSVDYSAKAIVTIQRMNDLASFDWMHSQNNKLCSALEEIELELHAYDFDTPYVKKILDSFDKLRSGAVFSTKEKHQSTFAILQSYFGTTQDFVSDTIMLY